MERLANEPCPALDIPSRFVVPRSMTASTRSFLDCRDELAAIPAAEQVADTKGQRTESPSQEKPGNWSSIPSKGFEALRASQPSIRSPSSTVVWIAVEVLCVRTRSLKMTAGI